MALRSWTVLCAISAALLLAGTAVASGAVGIYAMIEKVIFEPNEKSPQRVQVWGAFEFVENFHDGPDATSMPKYGYLYFKLPGDPFQLHADVVTPIQERAARTEWGDLKRVAGAGQAIAFGNWKMIASASDAKPLGDAYPYLLTLYPGGAQTLFFVTQDDMRVRPPSDPPYNPAVYSTNAGIVKLTPASHAKIINQLKEALKNRSYLR
jgi:hypothetical protein